MEAQPHNLVDIKDFAAASCCYTRETSKVSQVDKKQANGPDVLADRCYCSGVSHVIFLTLSLLSYQIF